MGSGAPSEQGQGPTDTGGIRQDNPQKPKITPADRQAAAERAAAAGFELETIGTTGAITAIEVINGGSGYTVDTEVLITTAIVASSSPASATAVIDENGVVAAVIVDNGGSGHVTPGIRKFVDGLPGLGEGNANNLGQYIPVAVPDTTTYPGMARDSDFSNTVMLGTLSPAPVAPTNLAASLQAGPQIRLTWRDNANNETGFVIERADNGGAFSALATVGGNTTSYVDTAVSVGNTYTYRVKAVNAGGNSAYSNEASVAEPNVPAAPSNLTGTAVRQGNNARVTLNWADNANNETGLGPAGHQPELYGRPYHHPQHRERRSEHDLLLPGAGVQPVRELGLVEHAHHHHALVRLRLAARGRVYTLPRAAASS